MKKHYITPDLSVERTAVQQMLAGSITGIGGDSGLELGGDDEEGLEADAKANVFGETLFD